MQRNDASNSAYHLLPRELKLYTFSFLAPDELLKASLVNKESKQLSDTLLRDRIRREFGINLPDAFSPASSYMMLLHEQRLFVAFSLLQSGCLNPGVYEMWIDCAANADSFKRFSLAVDLAVISYCAESEHARSHFKSMEQEYAATFKKILSNPAALQKEKLPGELGILCYVNASHTIRLVFSMHPELKTHMPALLREAIASLNLPVLASLYEFGGGKHEYLLCIRDTDNSCNLFCSQLYFALMLEANPQCAINRLGPAVKVDNARLFQIIKFLLNHGANPGLYCIFTDLGADNISTAKMKYRSDANCITLAREILDNPQSASLDPEYTSMLANLIEQHDIRRFCSIV